MRRAVAVLFAAAVLAGCTADRGAAPSSPSPPATPSPEGFGRGTLVVDTGEGDVRIRVEIADTTPLRVQGLRGRRSLAPDAGMVFLPAQPEPQLFVMEDTLIPLSVAWWDEDGRIFAIQDMEPCPAEPCPLYGTDEASAGAVEVNRGFFRRRGIEVGDRVTLER